MYIIILWTLDNVLTIVCYNTVYRFFKLHEPLQALKLCGFLLIIMVKKELLICVQCVLYMTRHLRGKHSQLSGFCWCSSGIVVWSQPVTLVQFPRWYCLLLLHWGRSFALVDPDVFPWARNFTHIAPAYSVIMSTYLVMLELAGEGKAGPAWKPTSLVDVAIQGKNNNTYLSVSWILSNHKYFTTETFAVTFLT